MHGLSTCEEFPGQHAFLLQATDWAARKAPCSTLWFYLVVGDKKQVVVDPGFQDVVDNTRVGVHILNVHLTRIRAS